MTEQKVSLPDRANIGKIIPTTYVSRRESLRLEVVRKEVPTYIDSLCRPPSKPPDKQNSLEGEISKKIIPYINPIYKPPPKPLMHKISKERGNGSLKRNLTQNQLVDPLQNLHIQFTIQVPSVRSPMGCSTNAKGKNEYKN